MDYREAWQLQLSLVQTKHIRSDLPDLVLLLEHPPVFTLGHRGGRDHLLVSDRFLSEQGIPLLHVERGGDITYHGPGQLVGYPVVKFRPNGWRVADFVEALEEVMIRSLADWGIQSGRKPLNRGVWVGMFKIGSVGIAVRRGISFHGFALNVNTSLEAFNFIHPCGLQGVQMTSVERILGKKIPMEEVRRAAVCHIEDIFDVELKIRGLEDIYRLLNDRK
jgi:lipoyl(octanoyl) transferase